MENELIYLIGETLINPYRSGFTCAVLPYKSVDFSFFDCKRNTVYTYAFAVILLQIRYLYNTHNTPIDTCRGRHASPSLCIY